jgi:hypothetical protein
MAGDLFTSPYHLIFTESGTRIADAYLWATYFHDID